DTDKRHRKPQPAAIVQATEQEHYARRTEQRDLGRDEPKHAFERLLQCWIGQRIHDYWPRKSSAVKREAPSPAASCRDLSPGERCCGWSVVIVARNANHTRPLPVLLAPAYARPLSRSRCGDSRERSRQDAVGEGAISSFYNCC